MKSIASWEREELPTEETIAQDGDTESTPGGSNISSLRELTFKLLRKVESIGEARKPDIQSGIDFYDEVSHFEIDLIQRALVQTGGHQRRAARLLNLKVTTLNSKIKHYCINMVGSVYAYAPVETDEVEARRRA